MKKVINLFFIVLFTISLSACQNETEEKEPQQNQQNPFEMEDIQDTSDGPTILLEYERKLLTKPNIETTEKYFLKTCDNYIVANYDIDRCVFEVDNETADKAECVIICEKGYIAELKDQENDQE